MAQYRGSRRASGTRAAPGRPAPRRGGGGNNTAAMAVAAIVVVGVIAVVVVLSGRKKPPKPTEPSTELTASSRVEKGPQPTEKPKAPPPDISPEIVRVAKEIVTWMEVEESEGNRHYEDAMAAKGRGDDTTWQAKLAEAREHFLNIRERWNNEVVAEIEGELPPGCEYDADEVANYHIGKEAGKVTKAIERLGYITKQLRMK
jgi:cell division protein FtsN